MIGRWIQPVLLATFLVLVSGTLHGEGPGPSARQEPKVKGGEQKPAVAQPKGKTPPVPDLRELLATPRSEFAVVVRRFDADHGNLNRLYSIQASPTRHARLRRFYADWLDALRKLNPAALSKEGRTDHETLQKTIEADLMRLNQQARVQAEIVPLVPFAATVIHLEESRRRLEKVDGAKAAGQLTALKKQIGQTQWLIETGLNVNKSLLTRAADTTAALRAALKNWHNFYDSYDPVFSWWVSLPYKDADQSLQSYVSFLREQANQAGDDPVTYAPGAAGPLKVNVKLPPKAADVPNLKEMLAAPQSELAVVLQRFQKDRGSLGGKLTKLPGFPKGPVSPERAARLKKFYGDWLAALPKLDFDKLSREGQVDYLLLKNHLERELRRLDLPPPKAAAKKDNSGITGRPIGREALLLELAGEMIPYTPEELIALANAEFAWCDREMLKASRDLGFGNDWRKALEKVKTLHVQPGQQPELIRFLAFEAIDYLKKHDLVTVPPLAAETWRMEMMSPQRQLVNPFFTGGETISVAFPTSTMSHEAKLQSMRGNNKHFSRATVHHELIPGHHLQLFMNARTNTHRRQFGTPFWVEGWALYWEFVLYDHGFPKTAEDRVGFLFWRMHRCARIIFSLEYHLGKKSPQECIDFLVERVGHERDNATAEVRRSFQGNYGPLYQAAYMLGGLQIRALRKELVDSGKMTERDFHDRILQAGNMPIAMVRAC